MNRKSKITVSIVGITIVLLALLGLTYGYYLTRIEGNTNTNSISVTTAKLKLVYGDNSAEILTGTGTLAPSTDLTNGGAIGTKTFTVTNEGEKSNYVVIIDNVSIKLAGTNTDTSFVSNDFRYTLICKKSDGTDCNSVNDLTIFPINGGILLGNTIDKSDVHTYTLRMWYIDTGVNQSDDMGKSYQARVSIADVNQMENPFKTGVAATDNASLAYNIINNAKTEKNGTTFVNQPITNVAEQLSGEYIERIVSEPDYFTFADLEEEKEEGFEYYYSDSEETACSGEKVTAYNVLEGNYLCFRVEEEDYQEIAYVESYDESTETLGMVFIYYEEKSNGKESVLSLTSDDYGTSYYYRGNVIDNYVTFADMCWRIVRIAGDGSIKLILEDQDEVCSTTMNGNWGIPTTTGGTRYTGNFGYTQYNKNTLTASDGTQNSGSKNLMDYLHGQTISDKSMATAFKNFQSTFTETELSKLKSGNWCLGDNAYDSSNNLLNSTQIMDNKIKGTSFYYDSYQRLDGYNRYQPTLKCNGTIMNDWDDDETNPTSMYVGAITADEVAYAGGKVYTANQNYYLINEEFKKGSSGANKSSSFWSLSPYDFVDSSVFAFYVSSDGYLGNDSVYNFSVAFRPSVSLASSAVISEGEGTLESPYVIG